MRIFNDLPKGLVTFMFLGALVGILNAQNSTYMRTYNFPGMNGGLGLSGTSDGGFVGTGQHENGPAGSCDVYVYKVTGCGSLEWYKTFGTSGSDGGKKVIQTADGGYVIAGLWNDGVGSGGSYEYMLMKINASGIVQWNTVFDDAVASTADYCEWVEEVPGGFITAGKIGGGAYGGHDAMIVSYNSLGAVIWARAFGGTGNDNFCSVHPVTGGYIATGYTTSYGAGNEDLLAVKVDPSGTPVWMYAYGSTGSDGRFWDTEGIPTPDGGYIIAGSTNNAAWSQGGWDVLLVKLDANGNVQWAMTYGLANDEVAEGISITNDGYVVTGYTYSNTNGGRDAFILKVDSLGTFQWAQAYGTAGADRGVDILPMNGGSDGYVLSMNRETAAGSGDYDPMFVRTDSLGDCGCNNISATYGSIDVTTLITRTALPSSASVDFLSNISISSPSPATGSPSPNENFICISCTPTTPSFTMDKTVMCENEQLTLVNTTPSGSAACFEWVANGNVFSNLQDTVVATFSPGTYTIQLNAICGNNTQSQTQTLIVNPIPTAGFTGPSNVCENNLPVGFTNTGSTGSNISYQWDFGNGATPQTSTMQNPSGINYTFGGAKNVKQVVINQYGCRDSVINILNVEPLPNLTFSANPPVCVGDTMNFTNNTWVGGTGVIAQWNWDFGDGNTSTLFEPVNVYAASGTYTVELKATSDFNCADSATITVEVSPPSVGGIVVTDDTVCAYNNNGTLTLTGQTGNPVFWEFSNDGGINWFAVSNTTTSQLYQNLASTTMFRAFVQSGACPGVYSDTATITVDMPSVGGEILSDTTVCLESNNGLLTASGYLGQITTWQYSDDTGQTWITVNNTTDTISFANLQQNRIYRIIVTNGVCPSDTSVSATVTVYQFNGAYAEQDSTISLGQQITLIAGGGVDYLWYPNYQISDTTTAEVDVNPLENTNYYVVVYDGNGCVDTAMVTITVVNDYNLQISNTITPNNNGYNDTWYVGNIENYPDNEVTIFNRNGQVIYNKKGYLNDWDGTYNGSKLPDGTYFYVIKFDNSDVVFKGHVNIINSSK